MDEVFTVKDISRLFGLSESRVRYWAQTGFINPTVRRGSRRFYSFGDLISIKVARDLLASGLSLQRVRKNLQSLREVLPDVERPLERLRINSDGERMWVHGAENAAFEAGSGQLMLSLDTGDLQDDVARILDLARPPQQPPSPAETLPSTGALNQPHRAAYRWFVTGLSKADKRDTLEEAKAAFHKTLELDPDFSAAHTNLGLAYFHQGELREAREHFERALSLDPEQPEARYNLANLYQAEGELELAVAQFRRVTAATPEFPDAHFNLAVVLEQLGSRVQAGNHFGRYLALAGEKKTVWSRLARGHLKLLLDKHPAEHQA